MPTKTGKGKSLAFTSAGEGGASSPITSLQGIEYNDEPGLDEFTEGTARTPSHWEGALTGYIQVEVSDVSLRPHFAVGKRFTDVILTAEGCKTSAGEAVNGDWKVTINKAVISERSAIQRDNTSNVPSTFTVRFTMSDHGDGTAPTMVEEAVSAE